MQIEDQVCNLELSRKLKELGVKQESYFWWVETARMENDKAVYEWLIFDDKNPPYEKTEIGTSALTVAELVNELPHFVEHEEYYPLKLVKTEDGFYSVCYYQEGIGYLLGGRSKTFADASAKCLIELIEKGIVKP